MKNVKCEKCLNSFHQKDIYTIQQFQYRKEPPYSWSLQFFKKLNIGEWDSFCEKCMLSYSKESEDDFIKEQQDAAEILMRKERDA